MKRLFTLLLPALFVVNCQSASLSLYSRMCAFNPNWKSYEAYIKDMPSTSFSGDRAYIQTHLKHVIRILKSAPVQHLTKAQTITRYSLIKHLEQYRQAGKFPINYYIQYRIPVFIDDNQTHCAVGYLMQQSGYDHLARQISRDNNYAWVKEIRTAGLTEWQQFSGFSLEELKLIQGAYDHYLPDALFREDKYDIPQKPAVATAYFGLSGADDPELWFMGEGVNGVLNGDWLQYHSPGMIWIVGKYKNGLKHGEWKEYYKGTDKLCRTEIWENDKLNGIRKRFDRQGTLIEEILFKSGKAVVKTNYNLWDTTVYMRYLIDSTRVFTQIFDCNSILLAQGHETILNTGNLQWFQNIELTALNSIAITARNTNTETDINSPFALYNTPPLVQYVRENDWQYYTSRHLEEFHETNYIHRIRPLYYPRQNVLSYRIDFNTLTTELPHAPADSIVAVVPDAPVVKPVTVKDNIDTAAILTEKTAPATEVRKIKRRAKLTGIRRLITLFIGISALAVPTKILKQ